MNRKLAILRILVAEDEPELLRFYKILLEDLGHQVVTARDGQECLDAYMKSSNISGGVKEDRGFDLVILDHKMPRMNGIDVANRIAAILPSQKLLMITAFAGVLELARKPENMRIMAKPFDVDELAMAVTGLLGNKGSH